MIKKLLYQIGCWLPLPVAKLIYQICFYSFKLPLLLLTSEELWIRNSYALNRLQALKSDLDLSLSLEKPSAPPRLIGRLHQIIQKLIPLLGELNIYHFEATALLTKHMNYYELQRDPLLLKKWSEQKLLTNLAERDDLASRLAFFSRALEADIKNLLLQPEQRYLKWSYHCQSLWGFELAKNFSFDQLLLYLIAPLEPKSHSEVLNQLQVFYKIRSDLKAIHNIDPVIKDSPWLLAFFPNHYAYVESLPKQLNEIQSLILLRQIEWEIFGALTQHFNFKDSSLFPRHILFLKNFSLRLRRENMIPNQLHLVFEDLELALGKTYELLIKWG